MTLAKHRQRNVYKEVQELTLESLWLRREYVIREDKIRMGNIRTVWHLEHLCRETYQLSCGTTKPAFTHQIPRV
jgi:hypothetical protein